ncbi:hypothetical protein GCM10010977_05750 [Citricoccus zhacaiensis]|uniref:Phage holin family protein n=1 Tax=Citricoccus zhacaiensis TaxID=489142 RepID=A0ABQ2LPQ7_9MICC|nr:hypothetical protein [Citricoccus zhacaiensis]GGO41557.1 hypothetical protein GCM10010977_05750 [Citricoccus zhacaiensis]
MDAVESGTDRQPGRPGAAKGRGWGSKGSGITFAVMVVVLLVALLFAANQNDVIGWLLVVISAGWLALAALVVLGVRRGARSVDRRMKDLSASLAPRVGAVDTPPAPTSGPARASDGGASDPMRDTKLDHSFKIVQVQTRVVTEELSKGAESDTDMIARALETIYITSANAREMIKESSAPSGDEGKPGTAKAAGTEGPITGEVIN